MPRIYLLGHHFHRTCRRLELWPINHRPRVAGHSGRAGRQIANGCPGDWDTGGSAHALNRNATMHDGIIMHLIVVDDGGLVVNRRDSLRRKAAMAKVVIAKVAKGDESEGVGAEAETKTRPHPDAIDPPAQP